ncbi:MAG: putative DNA binding domain-containing protein [Clostridiales Family XIII bacterium]|jgi:ATP-dependent DNA helicase RecG|nr:putative DNA binding domain-containing protein [Clostridiales Family XIII bacterium]
MNGRIQKLLRDGEGLTVEFKRCHDRLSQAVYETVCAFSNRYGGDILLGVENDGKVTGVAPEAAKQLKKDFANALNNPQMFSPTLFIELENVEIDGKTVLCCHIPFTSQLVMLKGRVFDRNADGDFDVTHSPDLVWQIGARKKGVSTEDQIYPHIKGKDLLLDKLIPYVKQMTQIRNSRHPWAKMSAEQILQSAGLIQIDPATQKQGYTLAAILLFGREEAIRAVVPGYVTDCILRRDDIDRYDDRLRVSCNLIEAFDRIMDFIAKHTPDRFYLEGARSVSLRSNIARELVSNILSHREFTSTVPARVVIERDRIVAENWCLPKLPGKLDPATFTPQPKNPLIANFFVNIGYADTLGSGVRNLYRYTKIYTNGEEPELIEGDMFRTIVPLSLIGAGDDAQMSDNAGDKPKMSDKMSDNAGDKPKMSDKMSDNVSDNAQMSDKMSDNVSDNAQMSDKMSDNVSDKPKMSDKMSDKPKMSDKTTRDKLLAYLRGNGEVTAAEAAKVLGRSTQTARRLLSKLVAEGAVTASGANRNRKYRAK